MSTTAAQDSAQEVFQRATLQAEGQRIADLSDDTTAALESYERATLQAEGQPMLEDLAISEQ